METIEKTRSFPNRLICYFVVNSQVVPFFSQIKSFFQRQKKL